MKITVIGGGNIGTQFAVHSAEKGHDVCMLTSNPKLFQEQLCIVSRAGEIIHKGSIRLATNNPAAALRDADMVMITMPPTMMIPLAEIIYENTDSNTTIGFVPGNGGFELVFRKCIERGNTLFGIDRVPAIARLTERGRCVCCSGYKEKLYVAALPSSQTERCSTLIESIYDIPCVRLPGFMALTLTPSNPILHTARLYTIFKDYYPGVSYERLPLFYEEWDDESSELLMACDDEIQNICRALPDFGLEYVISEKEFYNAYTVEEMTRAISTEESLLGLATPAVCADNSEIRARGLDGLRTGRKQRREAIEAHAQRRTGWRDKARKRQEESAKIPDKTRGMSRKDRIAYLVGKIKSSDTAGQALIPDLHSRYFTADFPYGLTVIQQIAKIAGADTPHIDMLLDWYDGIAIVNDKLMLSDYGITDIESMRALYLQ